MPRSPLALVALALALAAGSVKAQGLKIGYINSQQILASSSEATDAQKKFDTEMQSYQAEVQQLENELNGLQQQYQQQQLTLSPEAKANREQQIQQKVQQYQQRTQELQQQADQRRQELIQPVMDKITAIIETMRQEGNYSLILDLAAGSIIAADTTLDLTQNVIQRLKAQETASGTGN